MGTNISDTMKSSKLFAKKLSISIKTLKKTKFTCFDSLIQRYHRQLKVLLKRLFSKSGNNGDCFRPKAIKMQLLFHEKMDYFY